MTTISSQKIRGFLTSPRTYPRGGLGFGIGGGGVAASNPAKPATTNRMTARATGFSSSSTKPASTEPVMQQMKANFQTKAADYKGKGMLEKIKQLALEKCAGDEEKAREFLEGFYEELLTKQAALNLAGFGGDRKHLNPAEEAMAGFSNALGKGLASLTMGLGATALSSATKVIQRDRLHNQFTQALAQAISSNRILREAKKEKVVDYAETIFRFAPHVATDANLLSSILANAIHGDGVDPQTIKTLTDLEARYTMAASAAPFSPKAYV